MSKTRKATMIVATFTGPTRLDRTGNSCIINWPND